VKEATIQVDGTALNIAVSNGLNNAKHLLDKVARGEKEYHLIEIMACPGGCVGGGGQPYPPDGMHVLDPELTRLRAKALYRIDAGQSLRESHENPEVQRLYAEFLGEPNGAKSHELLHTSYAPKEPGGVR
jgi:iron only hydrogenase large subunit-like protein